MIDVKQLTRKFGSVTAVEDLSFSAEAGEVIGLLGQNGAGKSTTLNMLTGYLPPSSGSIMVNGLDMMTQPRECKRAIGYLPEKPPLYDEMTVREYLRFVCRLKEVTPRGIAAHMDEILQLCGLTQVRDRVLGNLSKGYRQRAGFAQTLCGGPQLLVLDEPTVGLDPLQVVEIRRLMRELGKDRTVIFSSHLLSQVQQLCSRVLILHRGKLVRDQANGYVSPTDIFRLRASIMGSQERLLPALKGLPSVRRVKLLPATEEGVTEVELECVRSEGDPQAQLFRLLCGLDTPLRQLILLQDTLQETFLRLTTKEEVTE